VHDLIRGVVRNDHVLEGALSHQGSPVTVSVKVPQIDYSSLQVRQVELERRRLEWSKKLRRQEMDLVKHKQQNFELIGQLKSINLQIDEMI